MKNMCLAVCIILLVLAVPVQSQTMTATQKSDIEKAVKERVAQLYSALDTLSPEAYVNLWSKDKIIGALIPTGLGTDFAVMAKDIQGFRDITKARTTESFDVQGIKVVSPDMAIAFSKTEFRAEMKNGNTGRLNMGNTTIWIRDSGEWKLAFMSSASALKQ